MENKKTLINVKSFMGNSLSKFELMYKYYNEFNFEIKKRVKNSYPFLEYKSFLVCKFY